MISSRAPGEPGIPPHSFLPFFICPAILSTIPCLLPLSPCPPRRHHRHRLRDRDSFVPFRDIVPKLAFILFRISLALPPPRALFRSLPTPEERDRGGGGVRNIPGLSTFRARETRSYTHCTLMLEIMQQTRIQRVLFNELV